MRIKTPTTVKVRGLPPKDGRSGGLRMLRRAVVAAVIIGLGGVAFGAAILSALSIATMRTMDAFRSADPVMMQARAWTSPGQLARASQLPPSASATIDKADVIGAITPTRDTASLNAPAPVSNRIAKADRLPLPAPFAAPQLSPPQTVAAAPRGETRNVAAWPAPTPEAARPAVTGSIGVAPTVVTTKRYVLASIAPAVAPVAAPSPPAAPLPLHRPAQTPQRADDDASDAASRTAVYVIAASTVHMPDGTKLMAQSGLGKYFNNPRYTKVKNQGPTPPNVYRLTLREKLFHGVRAVRLTPVFEDKMYGRDGMLAHSYLLGPKGESNGCVSFADYPKFLQAFLDGKVDRMVVVPDLKSETLHMARARGRHADRVALNN